MNSKTTRSCTESLHIVMSGRNRSLTPRTLKQLQSRFAESLGRFSGKIREAQLTLQTEKEGLRRPETRSRLAICLDNWNVVVADSRHARATIAASRAIEKARRELSCSLRHRRRRFTCDPAQEQVDA